MTVSIAISEVGRVIRNDGAGAIVPWWSFTKTLIAATVLALVRDGVLRLDDQLPGCPYTSRLLLQHRAGLADYGELKDYHEAVSRDEEAWSSELTLERADAERLRFEPGQGWGYSNIGYLLMRRHLETVCGEGLDVLLKRLIFAPLGVITPRVVLTRSDLEGVVLGNRRSYDPQWVYHGLVVGALGDAAQLLDRLMTTDFLPTPLLAEMCGGWPVESAIGDRPWRTTAYGLGVMTGTDLEGSRVMGHSGAGPGSVIAIYHHSNASPSFTVAAFSSGDNLGQVELAAFGSKTS
jgi:CubicO group peptidase (beta-lactamase class C family)